MPEQNADCCKSYYSEFDLMMLFVNFCGGV